MSEPSMIVEVPGVPRLSGALRPAERCTIPLEVRARLGPFGLLALANGLFGIMIWIILGLGLVETGLPLRDWWVFPILLSMALLLTISPMILVFDCLRPQPLVYLGRDSFFDARCLTRPIAWSEIAHAAVTYRVPGIRRASHEPAVLAFGVTLRLRGPITARHNRFRLGTLSFKWRRQPDEIYVPVLLLDTKPNALAGAILALVQKHGGSIER